MKERKTKLLKMLQERMREWEMASVYRDAQAQQLPTDILTTLITEFGNGLEDAMGEFFFLPELEGREEDALCFNCVLTLAEDLVEDYVPALYEAIALLNYYMEAGAFAVNKEKTLLAYRNSLALPIELGDEAALDMILANIAYSINVAERFSDLLVQISDGRMSVEELKDMLP